MQANFPLKIAAIASSMILAAVFVCYRAGALEWRGGSDAPAEAGAPPSDDEMFGSTKSAAVFEIETPAPGEPPGPATSTSPNESVIIGGTKSLQMLPTPSPQASNPSKGK
ncbi:MAG: hypothetical protein QGG36_06055 [Pirellulaceae bacterium]|jgi:hypothetical protein|nr:hypothetical protein [Pirellulaceae bacterium]MDP7015341.1 hypothetical protein [Pirellulaceae bacterium]